MVKLDHSSKIRFLGKSAIMYLRAFQYLEIFHLRFMAVLTNVIFLKMWYNKMHQTMEDIFNYF